MYTHLGESTILEIGINYLDEVCMVGYEIKIPLIQSMSAYLSGQNTYEQSKQTFLSVIGRTEPLDRLKEIVDIAEEPASEPASSSSPPSAFINGNANSHYSIDNDADTNASAIESNSSSYIEQSMNGNRRKTRSWSPQEDTRLLAGIYKYGIDNWTTIATFIGNGRTRAQCCQRWTRGLNPRVSKNLWSYEEDLKLVHLVYLYGDKSWTKIASMMGNRSDVQCRYHYRQVMRDMPPLLKAPFNLPHSNLDKAIPNEYEEIKTAIEGILPSRYSMPQFSIADNDPSQYSNQNLQSPSQNFISFAQDAASGQINFQSIPTFSSSLQNTSFSMPMRSVLSLPSFDNEATTFNANSDLTTTNLPSPAIYPTASANMQLVLDGIEQKTTCSLSPKIRSASNSSPIPAFSSFCSPSLPNERFAKKQENEGKVTLERRDSAPPINQDKKMKFPSPDELGVGLGCPKSFSGLSRLDNFLNDFR